MDKKIIAIITAVVVVFVVAIGGMFWWIKRLENSLIAKEVFQSQTKSNQVPLAGSGETTNEAANENISTFPLNLQDSKVEWYGQPKNIDTPQLFEKGKGQDISAKAWEVGKIKSSDEKIIFISVDPQDPGGVRGYIFLAENFSDGQKLKPISRYSTDDFLQSFGDSFNADKVTSQNDDWDIFDSLEYPGFLVSNNAIFQQERDIVFEVGSPFFEPQKFPTYKKIFTDKMYGDAYLNSADGGIYLKSPVGTAKVYSVRIDFMDGDIPRVTWNDGTKAQDNFTFRGAEGGCGAGRYVDDVSKDISTDQLEAAGKTSTGETIFEYKDKNTDYLKKWYQEDLDFMTGQDDENSPFKKNTTYDDFVKRHVVFFWKDPLGRLIRFLDSSYVLGGGCGKPVIYLYPQQKEQVSVKVYPNGGLTKTEPDYGNGWNVIADPLSRLKNLADGKIYPYLFWEGKSKEVRQMSRRGFVTEKENLENLFNEKLSLLGLNAKEISDFKEFWLPKMLAENKPYYFVTFVSQTEINKLAPLEISPKPDTVIRVLMDYKCLDEKIDAQGYDIKTPERQGFTAVEWGGVLK